MVRIAIVGTGGIARRHVKALLELSDAKIVAMIDLERAKAQEAAACCGAEVYDGLGDCLDEVDAVYILTPPFSHRTLALEAIEAGKHVFCEKPLSISLDDAEAIVAAAASTRVKFMVGFNHRFREGFSRLKSIAESGELGKIMHFWSHRIGPGASGKVYNWRTDPEQVCGMSVESLSHDIDIMRWIAGEAKDVRANVFASLPHLPQFDNNANVVLTLKQGGTGLIHASWASRLGFNSRGVIGTKGTAYISGPGLWSMTELHRQTEDMDHEAVEIINDYFDDTSYLNENRHFVECIETDQQPSASARDGLETLRISHAILESHSSSTVVVL